MAFSPTCAQGIFLEKEINWQNVLSLADGLFKEEKHLNLSMVISTVRLPGYCGFHLHLPADVKPPPKWVYMYQ